MFDKEIKEKQIFDQQVAYDFYVIFYFFFLLSIKIQIYNIYLTYSTLTRVIFVPRVQIKIFSIFIHYFSNMDSMNDIK